MPSFEDIFERFINTLQLFFRYIGLVDKDVEGRKSHQAYQEIKEEVGQRKAHRQKIDLSQDPSWLRWLYRLGFAGMLVILIASWLVYAFQGSFHREWINPYSVSGQSASQALAPSQIALALFGTVGIPPFAVFLSLGAFLLGWLLMVRGLSKAHPLYSVLFVTVLTGQLWLLWSGVPAYQLIFALASGGLLLLIALVSRSIEKTPLLVALTFLAFLVLLCNGVALYYLVPSHMELVMGLSTVQISTILMLVFYRYLLGRDAMDGTVTLGHWYAFLTLRLLKRPIVSFFTLLVLMFSAYPYLTQSVFDIPFGGVVLLGVVLLILRWIQTRRAPDLMAVNLFLLTLVVLVVASKGMLAYFPKFEQQELIGFSLLSPVMIFIYATIWSFYSSAPLFVNRATPALPRISRLFLNMGWVLLASNCLFFFVAARDDMFMVLSNQLNAEAFLCVALPFFLYLLTRQTDRLLVRQRPEFGQRGTSASQQSKAFAEESGTATKPKKAIPGVAFVLLGVVLLGSVHLVRGLSIVTYAKVAYHTAIGNIALRANRYKDAGAAYERAIRIYPQNYKPYALKGLVFEKLGQRVKALKVLERATQLQPMAIDPWLQLGAMYRQELQYKKALHAYSQALKLDPSDSFVYRNVGICLSHMGEYKKAVASLEKALAIMPGKNEFGSTHYAALASIHIRAKGYKAAHKALAQALKLVPTDFVALSDLGILYQREKQPERALAPLRKAHRLRPENYHILAQLIALEKRLMQMYPAKRKVYAQSIFQTLERSVKASPQDIKIVETFLHTALSFRAYARAERLLQKVKKRMSVLVHQRLVARLAMRRGQFTRAQKVLGALHKRYPKDITVQYNIAQMYHLSRRYGPAVGWYRKVLNQSPKHFMALLNLTMIMRQARKPKLAWMYARRLQKVAPNDSKVLFQLALLYQGQRQYKRALPLYKRMLEINPQDWNAVRNLATTYHIVGRYRQSIPLYLRYLKSFPRSRAILFHNVGEGYQRLRMYAKALPYFRVAAKTKSPGIRRAALSKLALCFQMLKQDDKALATYKDLLEVAPKDVNAMINIAMIHRFAKRYKKAKQSLQQALRVSPNQPSVMLQLAILAQVQGQTSQAIRILRRSLKKNPRHLQSMGQVAFLYEKKKRYRQAYEVYVQRYRLYPRSYGALYPVIATASYRLKKSKLALKSCDVFSKLPVNPRHRRYRAILYACAHAARSLPRKQHDVAIAWYTRILRESQERDAVAAVNLAVLHGQQKKPTLQQKYLSLAVQKRPKNVFYRLALAKELEKLKRPALALREYKVLQRDMEQLPRPSFEKTRASLRGLPLSLPKWGRFQRWVNRRVKGLSR